MIIHIEPTAIVTSKGYIATEVHKTRISRRLQLVMNNVIQNVILSAALIYIAKKITSKLSAPLKGMIFVCVLAASVGAVTYKNSIFRTQYRYVPDRTAPSIVIKASPRFIITKGIDTFKVKYLSEHRFLLQQKGHPVREYKSESQQVIQNKVKFLENAVLSVPSDDDVIVLASVMTFLHKKLRSVNIYAGLQLLGFAVVSQIPTAIVIQLVGKNLKPGVISIVQGNIRQLQANTEREKEKEDNKNEKNTKLYNENILEPLKKNNIEQVLTFLTQHDNEYELINQYLLHNYEQFDVYIQSLDLGIYEELKTYWTRYNNFYALQKILKNEVKKKEDKKHELSTIPSLLQEKKYDLLNIILRNHQDEELNTYLHEHKERIIGIIDNLWDQRDKSVNTYDDTYKLITKHFLPYPVSYLSLMMNDILTKI
jgi:hypothetical protein